MSEYSDYIWKARLNALLRGRKDVKVATDFHAQVDQINCINKNDVSALMVTMINFMVASGNVEYRFETGNAKFNKILSTWKASINKDINPDIPRGLRSVTEQYLRERWNSSLVVLNIQWGMVGGYEVPINLWFNDGGQITIKGQQSRLGGYEYFLGRDNPKKIVTTKNKTFMVRKPFESLYTEYPTPYLTKRGATYHALVKQCILEKQSDLIHSIVPHILLAKVGSDKMGQSGEYPTEQELIDLKEEVRKMTQQYNDATSQGKNIGAFPHDVDLENLIPDLTKFITSEILNPSDKNILSALGLIELEGFSKSRQETILNPKVLVEEVVEAVLDWREMLNEISLEIVERNKKRHPKIDKDIKVIPGIIKSFLTNDDKVLIRSAFDRGTIGHQDFIEILPFDFETTLQRRIYERDNDVNNILYPHIIMNQEATPDANKTPEETKEETPEKKKTEKDIDASTNEIEDFTKLDRVQSVKEYVQAPYDTIDDLPDNVKNVLPVGAQVIWLNAFNSAIDDGKSEASARKIAWGAVKKKYKKVKDKDKWVKK